MAFNDVERKRYEKIVSSFVERIRPSPSIRKEVDISFRIKNQSIELFELRPHFLTPEVIMELPVAKTTYVKRQNNWKIFWQRADCKWHSYDPCPEVETLDEFIKVVEEDQWCCFWG